MVAKVFKIQYFSYVAILAAGFLLQSCVQEAPFENIEEGTLNITPELRSDVNVVTRADIEGYDDQYLKDNLVVYIKNSKGVIRKYKGEDELPPFITLPVGTYAVEGWTGDSASADFSKKFFRGITENIQIGSGNTSLSLKLDIANVIATVDKSALDQGITDLKVKVYHSRGELTFTDKEVKEGTRGYFMMPSSDANLKYRVEGKNQAGKEFSVEGEIKAVQRAHLYNLKLTSEPKENTTGGGLIRLTIEDIPVIDQSFEILPPPTFKLTVGGQDADFDDQLVSTDEVKNFSEAIVRLIAYEELTDLTLNFSSNFGYSDISGQNIIGNPSLMTLLKQKGIDLQISEDTEKSIEKEEGVKVIETYLTFPASYLNYLPEHADEYSIEIRAEDKRRYVNSATLKIANTESAVFHQDPISSGETPVDEMDKTAVLTNSAIITANLYDDNVNDYGILYRIKDSGSQFQKVSGKTSNANLTRAGYKQFTVKLEGLTPGKIYEYKAYAGDFQEPDSALKTFETEIPFTIPNADMSLWSTGSDGAYIPGEGGFVSYWDSGNHGSITLDVNLTNQDNNFIPGNTIAKLRSQFVNFIGLGKFAAGNIFIGKYAGTDGMDGILELGREYNSSHPRSLKLKANYRPGLVDKNGKKSGYLNTGDYDHGQIYIALTTEIVEIRTKSSNQKLFNPQGEEVIAYGQVSWDDVDGKGFGPDNKLQLLEIPFVYKDKAKSVKPKYLIVVCSASKYGDYFCGGEGSTLYVDDFELEYGDIQFE